MSDMGMFVSFPEEAGEMSKAQEKKMKKIQAAKAAKAAKKEAPEESKGPPEETK